MLCDKDAQVMARAARSRGSHAVRARNGGQSLIVTIIVLFVLLFLGGVFVALIANNLRNTRRGTQVSAAGKFSEAGIKYLDQQLMTSSEGADWRPVPRCTVADDCTNMASPRFLSPNDPDYFWLKPLTYNTETGQYEGGHSRIEFGGPTASQSNLGGRALVRVTYRPYRADPATGDYREDLNNDGDYADADETIAAASADRTRRLVKLESVGRVGIIDPLDPTTYKNSEGKDLRRELVAYKALGLTESLRFITDKDKRRAEATLGAPVPVLDRSLTAGGENSGNVLFGGLDAAGAPLGGFLPSGARNTSNGSVVQVRRPIYNVYQGAIRSNTDLKFYGLNYVALDPRRGDSVQVAGNISLSSLNATLAPSLQQTKVLITPIPAVTAVASLGATTGAGSAGNLLPSNTATFDTLGGLVRDNPRGNETQDLPDASGNNNLRAVPRLEPPLMDAVTGDNGLTRYRALTRDSSPLDVSQTGNDTSAGSTTVPVLIDPRYAGAYGWGQNLYIPNAVDLPVFADSQLSNTTSQRAEWLTPPTSSAGNPSPNWSTDGLYIPPAVRITLTPRWMAVNQSQTAGARTRTYLRRPDTGRSAVTTPLESVIRFTYNAATLNTAPTKGIDEAVGTGVGISAAKYAGYPAVQIANGLYEGEYVIFAEGNIRIKGSVGGVDPETGNAFIRHLTVVSNGTIYIDGNLLRDNITPEMVTANPNLARAKGKSTIALLAKNYIAVNTTQFLSPADYTKTAPANVVAGSPAETKVLLLSRSTQDVFQFEPMFGSMTTYDSMGLAQTSEVTANQSPTYLPSISTPNPAYSLSLLLRHAPAPETVTGEKKTGIRLGINANLTPPAYRNFFNWPASLLPSGEDYVFDDQQYRSDAFPFDAVTTGYLYPNLGYPYTAPAGTTPANQVPAIGIQNRMRLQHSGNSYPQDYRLNRLGIVPLDVRIEALMYAQEGSFFVIPGAWFNPDSEDTLGRALQNGGARKPLTNAAFPFYSEPLDIRITLFGAITENLPAEIGDQGAWLQKWGWVPRYNGSTGLGANPTAVPTFHGSVAGTATATGGVHDGVGNGLTYIYDPRLASPYDANGAPIRSNPNFAGVNPTYAEPLPPMPRLPLAPGLLY